MLFSSGDTVLDTTAKHKQNTFFKKEKKTMKIYLVQI